MKYISTRGIAPTLNFEDVLLAGLASDGGLYMPEELPKFSKDDIDAMAGMSYAELAFKVTYPFVEENIPANDYKKILDETYKNFRHAAIAPIKQLGHNEFLLELFHGPTLAFKDFALQLLGRLFDYVLEKQHRKVTIIGATSGDTGSAAIYGCKDCKNVSMFILHPHNRVSDVQRKQMTTVITDNVHNIAVEGNFDDCQNMVKAMFHNQDFLAGESNLVAVNSINWARIMAQIVYYFYSAVALGAPNKEISFSVPTGNFGDIFAGYLAKKMGLPIKQLVIATNKNDILHRFMTKNEYSRETLFHTLSPSMDIQISSNFERLLFDLYEYDGDAIRNLMEQFKTSGVSIEKSRFDNAKKVFSSFSVDDETTCQTIKELFDTTEETLDPHSAIGVKAARECSTSNDVPMVTLATAHPAKFAEAVTKAGLKEVKLPNHLSDLMDREEKFEVLPNDLDAIKAYIKNNF